jgi:hypothetical protein
VALYVKLAATLLVSIIIASVLHVKTSGRSAGELDSKTAMWAYLAGQDYCINGSRMIKPMFSSLSFFIFAK